MRRVLWIVALLLVCCVVTNRLTRWFVRADARAVCNDAIDFVGIESSLGQCAPDGGFHLSAFAIRRRDVRAIAAPAIGEHNGVSPRTAALRPVPF